MDAQIRGTSLFYDDLGQGMPLLLLHGGMGLDHSYFRPWLDPLAESNRVIYVDQRGHGRSSPIDSFEGIVLSDWVEDVEALRGFFRLDRFVLFGHSAGGIVAQAYAREHGERLAGLVLCNTACCFDYFEEFLDAVSLRANLRQLESVQRLFTVGPSDDEDLRQLSLDVLPLYFSAAHRSLADETISHISFRANPYRHFAATVFATFDSRPWLPTIETRTLVLDGAEDVVTPTARAGARLRALLPNATHFVFDGCGHFPFAENPGEFLTTLRAFLASLPAVELEARIP